MNFDDAERIQLIDISSEDDLLIDSHLDSTSFDLRLSVSIESQKELQSDHKSEAYPGTKDRIPSLAKVERKNPRLERGEGDSSGKECSARKSLAWDQSFFTNAGFLELDELCLVNQGFKNLKVSSSHDIEAGKGKASHGRILSRKPSSGAGSRPKIQSSMKARLVSPSKMVPMQSSKRQEMTTGRSESFAGVVARSHIVQKNTSSRKETLKSTRIRDQSSASTEHIRKPPLRASSKSGLATSIPVGISPYKSSHKLLTASLSNPQETQDSQSCGLKEADPQDIEALNFEGHQNNHQLHSFIKQSPISTKASGLRQPSLKIGFFDMKPKPYKQDQDGMKHHNKGKLRSSQPSLKKQTLSLDFEEKENHFHPEDTVIELELNKDNSPKPSQKISNGSSTKKGHSGQCSTSSKKPVSKIQNSVQKNLLSPIRPPKTPFLSKLSPWKKSAAF